MTDTKREQLDAGRRLWPRKDAVQTPTPLRRESDRQWMERSQASNLRHAAITRSLYSLSSYQSWTDRMRSQWQDAENDKD